MPSCPREKYSLGKTPDDKILGLRSCDNLSSGGHKWLYYLNLPCGIKTPKRQEKTSIGAASSAAVPIVEKKNWTLSQSLDMEAKLVYI